MPLYEYQCNKCGHRFEKIRKFSDPELKKCPECGGKLEQLVSAPAVQFKGSGWYVTDYANRPSAGTSSSKSDSEHKSQSERKSESESKSDAKSDSDRKSAPGKESASKKETPPKVDAAPKKMDKK